MIGSPDFVHEQNHEPRFQGPLEPHERTFFAKLFSQNKGQKCSKWPIGMSGVAVLPTQTMHY